MTIYIAGKMTGEKCYNFPKFYEVEEMLLSNGHKVLNPAKIPIMPKYEMYYPINKAMLDGADAIYMLDGWEDSKGAVKEYEYAIEKGLLIYGY